MFDFTFDQLWMNALAILPIALFVTVIARWVPCKPATRHAMWLLVLGMFVLPSVIIGLTPEISPSAEADGARGITHRADAPPHDNEPMTPDEPREPHPDHVGDATDHSLRTAQLPRPAVPASTGHAEFSHPSRLNLHSAPGAWFFPPIDPEGTARAATPRDISLSDVPPYTPPQHDSSSSEPQSLAHIDPESQLIPADGGSPSTTAGALDTWVARLADVRDALAALPPLPAAVWLGGIALVLVLMIERAYRTHRIIRRALPADRAMNEVVRACTGQLKLATAPRVVATDACISPMVWCGRSPILVLPRALWRQLDDAGRRAIVCHELAHLKRRDHWVRWCELVVSVVYWWHPVLWWVRRRIRDEADACCDIWVTHLLPTNRRAYAEALLESRKYLSAASAVEPVVGLGAHAARTKPFARRLTMVMTQQFTPRLSLRGVALTASLAALGALVAPIAACPPDDAEPESVAPPTRLIVETPDAIETHPEVAVIADDAMPTLATTFERHAARAANSPFAGAPPEDADLEARMRRLEERMNRLMEQLDRLVPATRAPGARSGGGAGAPGLYPAGSGTAVGGTSGGGRITSDSSPFVGGGAGGPRTASGTISTRPGAGPAAPGAGGGAGVAVPGGPNTSGIGRGGPSEPRAVVDDPGANIIRRYYLPEGKLKELSELMIRADVPVLVDPEDAYIEVHGSASQHRTFEEFCRMIHPEGLQISGDGRVRQSTVDTGDR